MSNKYRAEIAAYRGHQVSAYGHPAKQGECVGFESLPMLQARRQRGPSGTPAGIKLRSRTIESLDRRR